MKTMKTMKRCRLLRWVLNLTVVYCRAFAVFCPVSPGAGRNRLNDSGASLARGLRAYPVMTAVHSAILFEFNAQAERGWRVAGQEMRAAGQGLPGRQEEVRQCR
ncbi:hypothetical protein QOZ96_001479 [Brevundimonas nasdae]|uniref:hypothetical protein n=1 Tax=Brevundimonas nasdae TaxID=172043 RepID=UPI0019118B42|nr:hypothetical protein [Brevundimonas nasdae]MBK6025132.1 hypothetical protein [Brevundimonas nasdae]MDQ0451532.1 hypothetical protein [Brevundimonas nasdae]